MSNNHGHQVARRRTQKNLSFRAVSGAAGGLANPYLSPRAKVSAAAIAQSPSSLVPSWGNRCPHRYQLLCKKKRLG